MKKYCAVERKHVIFEGTAGELVNIVSYFPDQASGKEADDG